MADEVENDTIRLLQEMRAEMDARFTEMNGRFDDLTNRIDGSALLLNMVAGLLSNRITKLERGRP